MSIVSLFGVEFDEEDFRDYGYLDEVTVNGTAYPRFMAMFVAALNDFSRAPRATSATSKNAGLSGSQSWVLATDVPFSVGATVAIARTSAPTTVRYAAVVTGYVSATKTLTVTVLGKQGSGGPYTDWTISVAGEAPVGRKEIFVPARDMRPSATTGCAALATVATAANQVDVDSLDFDQTTQEYAQFCLALPKAWDGGTITAQFYWSHASGPSDNRVVWNLAAGAASDDDAIGSVSLSSPQQVADGASSGATADDLYVTAETPAITVGGSPAAGDLVFFRVSRVTGNASDVMAADARLMGVKLFITLSAVNDA
jgi:hypothetical protein